MSRVNREKTHHSLSTRTFRNTQYYHIPLKATEGVWISDAKRRCTKRTWYLARIFHSVLRFVKHEPRACWIWTSTVVWKQHLYPAKLLWGVCWFGESDYHFSHVFLFQKEHWTVVPGARKTWDFPFRCVLRSHEPFQQDYFNCSSQSLKLFWTQNWDMCLKYSLVLGKLNNILLSLFPSRVLEWH